MVFKRGAAYYYKFSFKGRQVYESTRQGNKRVAETMEAARRTALAMAGVGIPEQKPSPTFTALCDRFLKWVAVEKAKRQTTIKFYGDMVRSLKRYEPLRNRTLDRIDDMIVEKFTAWRCACGRTLVRRKAKGKSERVQTGKPLSVATINRERATLRRMLNLAQEWGMLTTAPPRIRLLPGEESRERVLSYAEEQLYLALAPDPLHDFGIVCVDTTIRPGETQRVRWENVHFDPVGDAQYGYIHNPEGGVKKRKRNLSMSARVRDVLMSRWISAGRPSEGWVFPGSTPEGFVNYSKLDSQHNRTVRRMKVSPPFRLYDLRHTGLTRLGESGADVFTIQRIAGHTDLKTTARYIHPSDEHLEQAMTRLEAYNNRKTAELSSETLGVQ